MSDNDTDGIDQIEIPDHMKCDVCGEVLYADEDWRPKPWLEVGENAEKGDYIHARCYSKARSVDTEGER